MRVVCWLVVVVCGLLFVSCCGWSLIVVRSFGLLVGGGGLCVALCASFV